MKNEEIVKEKKTIKHFSYNKAGLSLTFSLQVDTTKDIENFIEILGEAKSELLDELSEMK